VILLEVYAKECKISYVLVAFLLETAIFAQGFTVCDLAINDGFA